MQQTAIFLCQEVQGCKAAYVQSDEISLLLTDYDKLETQAWFDNNLSKITSVSASLATGKFNELRIKRASIDSHGYSFNEWNPKLAFFDSRAFNIPKEEVANYFLARQLDAIKNSISMLAQSLYSQKQLHGKNQKDMLQMCLDKGIDWDKLSLSKQRGSFILKNTYWNGELVRDNGTFTSDNYYMQDYMLPIRSYNNNEIVELTIRTKWELVKTPLFNQETFNLK